MALTSRSELIADYWREFGERSRFEVLVNSGVTRPLVVTKSGQKPVGALVTLKGANGALVLLPNMDLMDDSFYTEYEAGSQDAEEEEGVEEGDLVWTDEGRAFGGKLYEAVVRIDASLKEAAASTPEPEWAAEPVYALPKEELLRQELLELDERLRNLTAEQQELKSQIVEEGLLRRLLYEKGKPLEAAIRAALEVLGFAAVNFKESDSEFDVVFESEEGRFIGEAEWKDNKAINISKLRQLEMNLLEDFEREEISEVALGVLFGNAFRLTPPDQRGDFFTEKVMIAAQRSGTVLVKTPDLFRVAQYLTGSSDPEYAARCREALLNSPGSVVAFPEPPVKSEQASVEVDRREEPSAEE